MFFLGREHVFNICFIHFSWYLDLIILGTLRDICESNFFKFIFTFRLDKAINKTI